VAARFGRMVLVGETVNSSESIHAQLLAETDGELRQALARLWVEAREFEAVELAQRELGAVEYIAPPPPPPQPWVTVHGYPVTAWFRVPGWYGQTHCVRPDLRGEAWCGRPIPHLADGGAPWPTLSPAGEPSTKHGKLASTGCASCWSRRKRWERTGDVVI
jgi:hypothetical protein